MNTDPKQPYALILVRRAHGKVWFVHPCATEPNRNHFTTTLEARAVARKLNQNSSIPLEFKILWLPHDHPDTL